VTARRRPTPAEIVAASANDNGKAVVPANVTNPPLYRAIMEASSSPEYLACVKAAQERDAVARRAADDACEECGYTLPGHDWNCSKVPANVPRPQATLREDVSAFSLSASPGEPHLPGVAEWLAKHGRTS
jgi:hypothetical protein